MSISNSWADVFFLNHPLEVSIPLQSKKTTPGGQIHKHTQNTFVGGLESVKSIGYLRYIEVEEPF